MISVRFCSLLFAATLLMAQSGPVTLLHQRPSPRLQNGALQPDLATQDKVVQTYGRLPLTFEANHGQTDAQVKFLSRGPGYTLFSLAMKQSSPSRVTKRSTTRPLSAASRNQARHYLRPMLSCG
jgi:hypothetical protein